MIKNFINKFLKRKIKVSDVSVRYGERYEINSLISGLRSKKGFHITSISVTRSSDAGGNGYRDYYLIAISYDYYIEKPYF